MNYFNSKQTFLQVFAQSVISLALYFLKPHLHAQKKSARHGKFLAP